MCRIWHQYNQAETAIHTPCYLTFLHEERGAEALNTLHEKSQRVVCSEGDSDSQDTRVADTIDSLAKVTKTVSI